MKAQLNIKADLVICTALHFHILWFLPLTLRRLLVNQIFDISKAWSSSFCLRLSLLLLNSWKSWRCILVALHPLKILLFNQQNLKFPMSWILILLLVILQQEQAFLRLLLFWPLPFLVLLLGAQHFSFKEKMNLKGHF